MAVDVSALKQAELLQAQSEQRVRSILTHAPDAFSGIDSQGCVQKWNRQAELTFGWTRDEVLGRPLGETLIPPEHRHGHSAGMKRFAVTGKGPVVNQRIDHVGLPMQLADQALFITTSVGIAFQDRSQTGTTAAQLLAKADEALYAAKAAGRGTFRVALTTPDEVLSL